MTSLNTTSPTPVDERDSDYWFSLIDEHEAAEHVGLTVRFLQKRRQNGSGPKFVRISSRCLKYRRIDLREWSESLLRKSTSDDGGRVAA